MGYHPRRLDDERCGAERSVWAAAMQMTGDSDASQAKQWIRCEQPELMGPALCYMATVRRRVRGS